MINLAVVIPTYKSKFFDSALASLANQTNKDFNVYIGDDCSPEDLKVICEKYSSELNIKYTRFDTNIGAEKLVNQWNRCVALKGNEKWIWLFSDDDIADINCVEVFYETIRKDHSKCEVYRFDTRVINDDDIIISQSPESPVYDTSLNMAYEILMGRRGNSMPDHIFSSSVYNKNGGFVYTDFAQAADWATSILFSDENGICTMKNAKVNWRIGSTNISGSAEKNKVKMLKGYLQFLKWTMKHFSYLNSETNSDVSFARIREAALFNLYFVIRSHYKGLSIINSPDILKFFFEFYNSKLIAFKSTIKLYLNFKFMKR